MLSRPTVSVVVPTFNRRRQLQRTLDGLSRQTVCRSTFEVIVVSDGSTDGTDEYLLSGATPLPVTVVRQRNAGPAAARNSGVAVATGELVLFIDDDVVPAPDLIAAHLSCHAAAAGDVVVIGPMVTPDDVHLSPWVRWEQEMLYKQYDAMKRGEYDATARQFYTGNATVARRHLDAVGGFDTAFRRAEDVELAYRLADRGLAFVFDPAAIVVHHAERSFAAWLHAASMYGHADVVFARDKGQRWLLASIGEEFNRRHRLVRALTRLCVPRRRLGTLISWSLRISARSSGAVGASALTRWILSALYNVTYYAAMADELGGAERLFELFGGAADSSAEPHRTTAESPAHRIDRHVGAAG